MKQHFSAVYEKGLSGFVLYPETDSVTISRLGEHVVIYAESSEITRACINRIVDNLNKLAEHTAKNGGINEV